MEIYLIVFILFDDYDLTFIYVCMYFVCYQNKQDTLAGECFPVSNRTNTFDIVQLDTVSLFNLSFQRRHCLKVHAKRRAERLTIQVHYYVIKKMLTIIWATSWENLFIEQQWRKSACTSMQSDQCLCCSLPWWYNTVSTCYIAEISRP